MFTHERPGERSIKTEEIVRLRIQDVCPKQLKDFLSDWQLEPDTDKAASERWVFKRGAKGSTELHIDKKERALSLVVGAETYSFSKICFVDLEGLNPTERVLYFLGDEGGVYKISSQGLLHSFRSPNNPDGSMGGWSFVTLEEQPAC